MQQNYDFRQELLRWHRPDLLCEDYIPQADMVLINDTFSIVIMEDSDEVLCTAAQDLRDYLFTSMRCDVALRRVNDLSKVPSGSVLVATYTQLGKSWQYAQTPASYEITVDADSVVICGFDARGCAQGCYQLEDRMTQIRAPYLKPGKTHYEPAFSPRMVHSGYGQEDYPDAHLSAIAHAGMDAILVMVKGVDQSRAGYLDFNNLIRRAAKYGLDVYVYSLIDSGVHPEDERAFAHYNSTYGKLFQKCPGFKGVVLVGESVAIPSKDPRVAPVKHSSTLINGLPPTKPTPAGFPCMDYPQWLSMLQKVIYPHKPDADIVLWTYNWGKRAEEDRLALIDALPAGITLMATFEMFNSRIIDGIVTTAADYTLTFPEAGPYFISEAKRAKERGIRLYAQANSAGRTWDFGVIPYEPFPEMWVRRYQSMLEMKEEYGLCGIMESHHYGFCPSFISSIEKKMFTRANISGEAAIRETAEELYGPENVDTALQAWHHLSEALQYLPITGEDQYGPLRIGPAYPMVLERDVKIPTVPYAVMGGNVICKTDYSALNRVRLGVSWCKSHGLRATRIAGEIRCLEKTRALLVQGRMELENLSLQLKNLRQEDCLRLVNLVKFIENTITTTIHIKMWAQRHWKLFVLTDADELTAVLKEMEQIAYDEIENAEATIPLVEADSHLGWEPAMEYICDGDHLRWKIRQVKQMLETELSAYLEMVRNNAERLREEQS